MFWAPCSHCFGDFKGWDGTRDRLRGVREVDQEYGKRSAQAMTRMTLNTHDPYLG